MLACTAVCVGIVAVLFSFIFFPKGQVKLYLRNKQSLLLPFLKPDKFSGMRNGGGVPGYWLGQPAGHGMHPLGDQCRALSFAD